MQDERERSVNFGNANAVFCYKLTVQRERDESNTTLRSFRHGPRVVLFDMQRAESGSNPHNRAERERSSGERVSREEHSIFAMD